MSSNPQDVNPMVSTYKKLFLVLSVITLIGIAIAVLHVPVWFVLVVGLSFILIKSVVVYGFFKKLLVGRQLIVITFVLTVIFLIGLLVLPILNHSDYIVGTEDISKQLLMEQKQGEQHGH